MPTTTAEFLAAGDLIDVGGRPLHIDRIEPYDTTALLGRPYPGVRLAHGTDGRSVTLIPGQHWFLL